MEKVIRTKGPRPYQHRREARRIHRIRNMALVTTDQQRE
jgi:hypothetical protein